MPPAVQAAGDDALIHDVVDNVPVALVWLDVDGVVRFAAGAGLTTGPEAVVGVPLLDLAETREAQDVVERALAGESVTSVLFWSGRHWQSHLCPVVRDGTMTGVACVFTDITAEVILRTAGQTAAEHLHAVIENAREAIIVLDPSGNVRQVNNQCSRLFGQRIAPGTPLSDLLGSETGEILQHKIDRRARIGPERYELRIRNAAGAVVWLLVNAGPILAGSGEFLGSVAVLTDITHAKNEQRRLTAAATLDPVTGVASRLVLQDRLQHALLRREHGVVAVLFVDVDRLKAVNDEHGHVVGDTLLKQVASRLSAVVRAGDTLVRYGGDEFVAVCEQLRGPDEAGLLAERMRQVVRRPLTVGELTLRPTVSIGVATSPPHADGAELLAAADQALYAAKHAGRDRVQQD